MGLATGDVRPYHPVAGRFDWGSLYNSGFCWYLMLSKPMQVVIVENFAWSDRMRRFLTRKIQLHAMWHVTTIKVKNDTCRKYERYKNCARGGERARVTMGLIACLLVKMF